MFLKFKLLLLLLVVFNSSAYADCTFNIQPLNFGIYNPIISEDNLSSSKIDINCSPTQNYTLKLSTGQSGSFNDRQMKNVNSDLLHYNLFSDSGRTTLFGDGQSATSYYSGQATSVYIYAIISARQKIPAGNYSDYLSLDLSF